MGARSASSGVLGAATGVVLALMGSALPAAADLTIAAASDLQTILPSLAAQFEQEGGGRVRLTFGSSGNLFAQIRNGAPFDVFFSADVGYPDRLVAEGAAEPGSLYRYAVGRLVLWARAETQLDLTGGPAALASPRVRRVAIANPAHAPYGRAAVSALERAGVYEQVRHKLVFGESVSQAAQFVQSGAADAGIIALSLALAPAMASKGAYVEIRSELHRPIEQAVVAIRRSKNRIEATRFLAFLKRRDVVAQLEAAGFAAP